MFSKIVVGTDGSDHAEKALRMACDIARKYGSELCLVHTPQPETVAFAMGAAVAGYHSMTTMPAEKDIQEAAQKVIDAGKAIAAEYGVAISDVHIQRGDPADEIVAKASEFGADLIVTGRRGLGFVGSLIQGSTTQRIGHTADCAVLSVI